MPQPPARTAGPATERPPSAGTATAAVPGRALRVLVVEDSARDWQLFEYLLEDFREFSALPLHCELARSGPEALERLAADTFDLVVLDQNMPEMNGAEVLAALRRQLAGSGRLLPRVLAYSTCDTPEFRRQCLKDGADGFASKYMTARDMAGVLCALGLDRGASL